MYKVIILMLCCGSWCEHKLSKSYLTSPFCCLERFNGVTKLASNFFFFLVFSFGIKNSYSCELFLMLPLVFQMSNFAWRLLYFKLGFLHSPKFCCIWPLSIAEQWPAFVGKLVAEVLKTWDLTCPFIVNALFQSIVHKTILFSIYA